MATSARRNYILDIDPETFEYVSGWPRIRRSIEYILKTRLKTRLMRLWWGSTFIEMQDKPGNPQTFTDGIMSAIRAVNLYEPEFKVTSCEIANRGPDGSVTIILTGLDLVAESNRRLQLQI